MKPTGVDFGSLKGEVEEGIEVTKPCPHTCTVKVFSPSIDWTGGK